VNDQGSRSGAIAGILSVLISLLLAADDSVGKTWRVEKDGTGDFTVIQAAADAAADGDTIRIGPGEYEEMTDYQVDCCLVNPVVVGIHRNDITILGSHRDSVLVGPRVRHRDGFGIVMRYGASTNLRLQDLTIRGLREGVRVTGYAALTGVRLTGQP